VIEDGEEYLEEDISELIVPEREYVNEEDCTAHYQTDLESDEEDESDWDYEEYEEIEPPELNDTENRKLYGEPKRFR